MKFDILVLALKPWELAKILDAVILEGLPLPFEPVLSSETTIPSCLEQLSRCPTNLA